MNFKIYYDKQPKKFLKKQDKQTIKRIMDKIDALLIANPVPHTAKRVKDKDKLFRIRIGKHRALYRINHETKKLIIVKIDKRQRVY